MPAFLGRHSLVFLALSLSACAGKGDDSGEVAIPGAELNGAWASACFNQTQTVLEYADLSFQGTFTEYEDAACSTPMHISAWSGTAAVGDEVGGGARAIDLAFETFTSTALTADNAALNNSYAYCGYTDWEAGVEKDVMGDDCYGYSIPDGGKSKDIYAVSGDSLRFGQGATISTAPAEADRPTTLDETRVFTRVTGG